MMPAGLDNITIVGRELSIGGNDALRL